MPLEFDEDKYRECGNAVVKALADNKVDQLSGALILLPLLMQSIQDVPTVSPIYTVISERLLTDLVAVARRYPELTLWKKNEPT
jgi:hypothetical protein